MKPGKPCAQGFPGFSFVCFSEMRTPSFVGESKKNYIPKSLLVEWRLPSGNCSNDDQKVFSMKGNDITSL